MKEKEGEREREGYIGVREHWWRKPRHRMSKGNCKQTGAVLCLCMSGACLRVCRGEKGRVHMYKVLRPCSSNSSSSSSNGIKSNLLTREITVAADRPKVVWSPTTTTVHTHTHTSVRSPNPLTPHLSFFVLFLHGRRRYRCRPPLYVRLYVMALRRPQLSQPSIFVDCSSKGRPVHSSSKYI